MSDEVIIRLAGVGKMFKRFPSRADKILDVLGLTNFVRWRRVEYQQFWALRGVDLEIGRGQRIGVIGRNGAGKSTLLKTIMGTLLPTEGRVEVKAPVHALIEAGGGFHPEFTGYDNIRAALTYQGLSPDDMDSAVREIADFTEMHDVLRYPLKTYSQGMQARLAFATATAINPEVLVIDEILGSGDAYFFSKSIERMKQLVGQNGLSVLIVSHALDQILRFCEESIWIEGGEIVLRGPSVEVVKAYDKFIRELENERLKGNNHERQHLRFNRNPVTTETSLSAKQPSAESDTTSSDSMRQETALLDPNTTTVSRWPCEGALTIERVLLVDGSECEKAVFHVGTEARLMLTFMAQQEGEYEIVPVAVLFRCDGIAVTKFIGERAKLHLTAGERRQARLDFGPINLGNGKYVLSVALYRELDINDLESPKIYDLLDRSYELEVFGSSATETAIFQHTGEWQVL